MVRRVRMCNEGPEVSRIAYGAWRLMEDPEGASPARVRAKIDACLAEGITTFDHADLYGGFACEPAFGAALAQAPELRARLELISKCGIQPTGPTLPDNRVKHYDLGRRHIVASVERSLRNLATDHLDVLLLHRPSPMMDAEETADALTRLRRAGKIRHAGVSNFTPAQFDLLQSRLDFPLCTNQIEVNLLNTAPFVDGTLDHCQTRRIVPMVWSPTAGGRIFTSGEERAVRVNAALASLAPRYGVEPEALAYAWLLAHPSRMAVVLGTNRIDRIRHAARADAVALDLQDWFTLWKASTGVDVA